MNVPLTPGEHIKLDEVFLTTRDGEYLIGLHMYENKQSERNTRNRIRNRTKAGLMDLMLVSEHLSQQDRDIIAKYLPEEEVSPVALVERLQSDPGGWSAVEEREMILLMAFLLSYDFIGRTLVNTNRAQEKVGMFAMLIGLSRKINRGEILCRADIGHLNLWLPHHKPDQRQEMLNILGLQRLEIAFSNVSPDSRSGCRS